MLLAQAPQPTRYTYDSVGNRKTATRQLRSTAAAALALGHRVAQPGERLSIFGANLPAGTGTGFSVLVGGVAAKIVAVGSTVLTIEVPAGTAGGPVVVVLPDGSRHEVGNLLVDGIGVDPPVAEVFYTDTVQFRANLLGGASGDVVWKVNGVAGGGGQAGQITPAGLYTAPASTSAGDFPFLVEAESARSGRSGFAVIRPACTETKAIAYGGGESGAFGSNRDRFCYEFDGEEGDVVSANYTGQAVARSLKIRSADGQLLAAAPGGASAAINAAILPEAGRYRFEVEPQSGSTGAFGVALSKKGLGEIEIPLNTLTTGRLAEIAQVNKHVFRGVAGSRVTIDFSTQNVGNATDAIVQVELVSPAGKSIAQTAACTTFQARLDRVALTETGLWEVRVRAASNWKCWGTALDLITGDYQLLVCPSNGDPTGIAYGDTVAGTFNVDCRVLNFDFDAEAGDVINVFYVGPGRTRGLELWRRLDGVKLASSQAGTAEQIRDVVLARAGKHRIVAEAQDNQTLGAFSLALSKTEATPVPIALNTPTPGRISKIGERDRYRFQGAAGSRVTIDFTSPAIGGEPDALVQVKLLSPTGELVAQTPGCTAQQMRLDRAALLVTGQYEIRVEAALNWQCWGQTFNGLTGDYQLTVCPSDGTPAGIAYGQTVGGTLTLDCQVLNFDFEAQAGDEVNAFYLGPARTRGLELWRVADAVRLATTIGGTAVEFRDLVLARSGTHRIVVEAQDNQALGAFSLALSKVEPSVPAPIAFNTPTPGRIEKIGERDRYRFTGVAGSRVTIDFMSPAVGGEPDALVQLRLLSPAGAIVAQTPACTSQLMRLDRIALEATGDYEIRVEAAINWQCWGQTFNGLTGDYQFTVCPSDGTPAGIAYGQTVGGTLTLDCQVLNFDFEAQAGDEANIFYLGPARTRGLDLWRLADGMRIATSTGGTAVQIRDLVFAQGGTHRLVVEAQDGQPLGAFTLSLSKIEAAPPVFLSLNTPTPGRIDKIGERDRYRFAGVAGSRTTIDFTSPAVGGEPDALVQLRLLDPSGAQVEQTPACTSQQMRIDRVVLETTGDYEIRVEAASNWQCWGQTFNGLTGDYQLTVCPSDGTPAGIGYGQTVGGTLTLDCQVLNFDFTAGAGDVVSVYYLGTAQMRGLELRRLAGGVRIASTPAGTTQQMRDVALPQAGQHRIVVEAQDNQTLGAFSLSLNRLGSSRSPIVLGSATPGRLDPIGDIDRYTFPAAAGARATVSFSTPNVLNIPDAVAQVFLISPGGEVFASTAVCPNNTATFSSVLLPEAGDWEVRVQTASSWTCWGTNANLLTGDYTITVTLAGGGGGAAPGRIARDDGVLALPELRGQSERFVRGDVDGDRRVTPADARAVLEHLFLAGPAPGCRTAADADDDGAIGLSDALAMLRAFSAGAALPPPSACGPDPTDDELDCRGDSGCSR